MTKPMKNRRFAEPTLKRPIRTVALVEDQPKVRESWIKLINSFPDFTCSCACATGEEALQTIPRERPDVVLMDIVLPRMSGIECTVRLKELLPNARVIIFTAMDDQELVFRALEAGADGYLLKRTKPAVLRNALLDALHGGAPMTSQIARFTVESFRQKANIRRSSRFGFLSIALCGLLISNMSEAVGAWTALAGSPPLGVNKCLLLSDGTVLGMNGAGQCVRLTPDIHGSYINGTWSVLATMNSSRLFFSSVVLTNGNVFVAGGEYGGESSGRRTV